MRQAVATRLAAASGCQPAGGEASAVKCAAAWSRLGSSRWLSGSGRGGAGWRAVLGRWLAAGMLGAMRPLLLAATHMAPLLPPAACALAAA